MDRDVAAPPSVETWQFTLVLLGNDLMKYRRVKTDLSSGVESLMTSVAILLGTFDGARFLPDQLRSFGH
jgi:hypothetical protein